LQTWGSRKRKSPAELRTDLQAKLLELSPAEVTEKAYQYCLFCLSRRDRSSSEMQKKIVTRGYSEETASTVIELLTSRNLLNDQRLLDILIRSYVRQSRGFRYAQQKLKMKGLILTESDFQRVSEEAGNSPQLEIAISWIERRYPTFSVDLKSKKKAFESLIRRGFSYDIAQKAVSGKKPSEF
jgi:regulatory protein